MRKFLAYFVCLLSFTFNAQDLNFKNFAFVWPDQNKKFDPIPDSLSKEDIVILNDDMFLDYSKCPINYISRRVVLKILNPNGLESAKTITLPQDFDISGANNLIKMGRFKNRDVPFIYDCRIIYFASRIIRSGKFIELPIDCNLKPMTWVESNGNRLSDAAYNFKLNDIKVGDIIEYTYKLELNGSDGVVSNTFNTRLYHPNLGGRNKPYGTSIFYFNSQFNKLNYNLMVKVQTMPFLNGIDMVSSQNMDTNKIVKQYTVEKGYQFLTYNYSFKNLKAVNYPKNSQAGKNFPHVYIDVDDLHSINDPTKNDAIKLYRKTNYKWFIIPDSIFDKDKIYDRYFAGIRKFISKFNRHDSDVTGVNFFSEIYDTLRNYTFVSAESMHYSEEAQYTVRSSEFLNKRKVVEEFTKKLFSDILSESHLFYFLANVEDRRLGLHTYIERAHKPYEKNLIAMPYGKSYKMFLPSNNGVKYYIGELPFYFEENIAALIPQNTSQAQNKEQVTNVLFVKTKHSTDNDNVRIENATFKVLTDSLKILASIKESISGQFSTLLRPLYANEIIDSTVSKNYYKKCTEKPNSRNNFVKQVSASKTYPFKTTYSCSEIILLDNKKGIDLNNWFSFFIKGDEIIKKPTHDFYLDFEFSDVYNYLFEFDKQVEILNIENFNKKVSNEYFEIKCDLTKQESNKYLLSVMIKAKKYIIPEIDGDKIIECANLLDEIGKLKIIYKTL